MRYFNKKQKRTLPNTKIDKFLSELHFICKKHKIVITGYDKSLTLVDYNKNTARQMLTNIVDDLNDKKYKEALENSEKQKELLEKRKKDGKLSK